MALSFFGIGMKTDLFQSVSTAEFSKFAGVLSVALSQHHLSKSSQKLSGPLRKYYKITLAILKRIAINICDYIIFLLFIIYIKYPFISI